MFQVSHIGNVAYEAHLITQVFQVAEYEVESDTRTGMSQMGVAIDGRTAHVHSHMAGVERFEHFLLASQCIVDLQLVFHNLLLFA
ncbi:hypothetical protein EVA_10762 [gut metagenome]|uniref:Uncharacterized protein n=1 Tax=gut metagenome TaxID=749906 RepID=J9GMR8_9ZZZZ